MVETCGKVPELVVPVELPITNKIHHMVAGFRTAQQEAEKAQWELNLQITELKLKAQPRTPPEV